MARIDYTALAKSLAGEAELLRTYYYNCLPYQGNPPSQEEADRYSKTRSFFNTLENLPRYTLRLGRLEYRGNDDQGAPRFEQKRVDILLGVDLVQLAAKRIIREAVLVAGDSDFIPAIAAAQSEGVIVKLYYGQGAHADLQREVDERTRITPKFIDAILRS